MADRDTTVYELKSRVMQLCRDKGWGDNGIQNPQHMAMAMTVEMAEMLEHFQWLEEKDVLALMRGEDPERVRPAGRYGYDHAERRGLQKETACAHSGRRTAAVGDKVWQNRHGNREI